MPKKIQIIFKLQRVFLGILLVSMILFSAGSAKADEAGTPADSATPTSSATPDPSTTAAPASPRPIFINEVMWQGASELIADEWLELYNNSDQIVDLSGYYLTDEAASSPKTLVTIPTSCQSSTQAQIAPHGTFLISKNNRDFVYGAQESYLNVVPDCVDSGLVLSNSQLQIGLYEKGGVKPIDIFGGNNSSEKNKFAPYVFKAPDPRTCVGTYCSLQRNNYSCFGDTPSAWTSSSEQANLSKNPFDQPVEIPSNIFATPGAEVKNKISNLVVSDKSYELNTAKKMSFTYGVSDMDQDSLQIIVNGNAGEDTFNATPINNQFDLPASNNCWNLDFDFYNLGGFDEHLPTTLNCYSTNSQIKFSEVLSAPKDHDWDGDGKADRYDEWLELQNQSNQNYDLANWSLVGISSSGATKTAKISGSILASGFLVFYYKDTGVTLSNDGEKLYLYDPGGQLVDQIEVPALNDNISYAKFTDIWKKTSLPTPGVENKLPEVLPSTSGSIASSSVVVQISQTSSEDQQANISSGVDSEVIVEQRIIHATLASYLVTNSTVLPKVDGAVMGSSDQRAQKPSKLSYNLLYFYFVLLGVVTISIFSWGIYEIYRRE